MHEQNTTATICDLTEMGLLKVSGPDAKKLLQGQLTCHMDEVTPSQSQLGAHCNPKGRVISLFYIFLFHDAYYLFMPHNMVSLTIAALKKFAIFYKMEMSDASGYLSAIGCAGIDLKEQKEEDYAVISLPAQSQRYIIVGSKEVMKHKWAALAAQSHIVTAMQWKQFDLIDGIPTLYPETSGHFLPHDIHLDQLHALHFDKGCYTGQEIIARMHYRGKIKNHLYQAIITTPSPPTPGMDIYFREHNEIKTHGMIVDVCHEESNRYYALINSDELHAKNNHLFLENNEHAYFTFPAYPL